MIWLSLVAFFVTALVAGGIVRWMRGHASVYGKRMPQRFHFGDVPRMGGAAALLGVGSSWLLTVLALGGAGLGAFGGRYLGQWLTIVSSAFAGAYFAVTGLALIFGQTAENGMMPVNTRTLVVFVLLATISFLAQSRTRNLRRSGVLVR